MKKSTSATLQCALVAFTMVIATVPARATGISDSLTVFAPSGAVFASVSAPEASEDPNIFYAINDPTLADPAHFGHPTTLCEDAVSPGGGDCVGHDYSDFFGVFSFSGHLELAFMSDTETSPSPFGAFGYYFLPEGGGVFDATMYLNPSLQTAGYTAVFRSVDVAAGVPEPGTLCLVGFGVLGLARRWRSGRSNSDY